MREIKLRGKRIKDGEWVFGLLTRDMKGHYRIQFDVNYFSAVVDPVTIGQYTGLKDKDGKEIYEGDIIHCEWWKEDVALLGNQVTRPFNSEVVWINDNTSFMAKELPCNGEEWMISAFDTHVVGNIHENSELLIKKDGE